MDRPKPRRKKVEFEDDDDFGLPPPLATVVQGYSECKELIRAYSGEVEGLARTLSLSQTLVRTCSQNLVRPCSQTLTRTYSGNLGRSLSQGLGRSWSGIIDADPEPTPPTPPAPPSQPSPFHPSHHVADQDPPSDTLTSTPPEFPTLDSFYPFYQSQHRETGTRVLHFVGTSISLLLAMLAAFTTRLELLLPAVFCGYFFAWIGHFFVEHNKPATFKYPVYSLLSDFRMYFNILTGRERFKVAE